MKTVFNNSMCAHVWAQLSQPHGRSDSMSFDGAVAYSYREAEAHIITPKGREPVVLFASDYTHSATTQRHRSHLWRASNQYQQFKVPDIFVGSAQLIRDAKPNKALHKANAAYLEKRYADLAAELMRCPAGSWRLRDGAFDAGLREAAHALHLYGDAFGIPTKTLPWLKDVDAIKARRDRLLNDPKRMAKREAAARAREAAEARKAAERLREMEAYRPQWRNGERIPIYRISCPDGGAMLRIDSGRKLVITSWGADVPLEDAVRVYRYYELAMRTGNVSAVGLGGDRQLTLGHFKLDSIDAAGNVKAGCHTIYRAELERFGVLLADYGVQP